MKGSAMAIRYFALAMGIIFLAVGVLGFIPAALTPLGEPLAVETLAGRLLGLFPVNILHSLVHVAFGVWGVIAYRTLAQSLTYAQVVGVAYAVLTVMGLIPGLRTVFGLIPLYGHDIWLHAAIAAAAIYFGFFADRREEVRV
jgi:hypothetical protein